MAKRKSRAKKRETTTPPPVVTTMEHQPVEAMTTICRRCGSGRRGAYFNQRSMVIGPERITWRRTICLDYCQYRDDVTREAVKQ